VGERVLEGVLEIGEELRLVHELGRLQARQAAPQLVLGVLRGLEQQGPRQILADDRRDLEEALVFGRQAVDARGQDRLDGRRDLDRPGVLAEAVRTALPDEHLHLDEGPDALLQKERVALRAAR